MSIRRNDLASDQRPASAARNPLRGPGTTAGSRLPASHRASGRCEQTTSHRTQYPLLHELCHALLAERPERGGFSYALEEVVVESATFVACASVGLATDIESVPYIAGWAGDEEPAKLVRQAAEAIDALARRVEEALTPPDGEEAAV